MWRKFLLLNKFRTVMNFMLAFLVHAGAEHVEHLHLTLMKKMRYKTEKKHSYQSLPHSVTMIHFYNSMTLILIVTSCVSNHTIIMIIIRDVMINREPVENRFIYVTIQIG